MTNLWKNKEIILLNKIK